MAFPAGISMLIARSLLKIAEKGGEIRGRALRGCAFAADEYAERHDYGLEKAFFRMTDALFFIGCSIDGTSRQPTFRNNRRNVWLRMRFSSLNYLHSNGWFRFRAKGVNGFLSAIDVAEKKNCGIMAVFAIPPELIWHWSLRGRQKGWMRFRGLGPAQRS